MESRLILLALLFLSLFISPLLPDAQPDKDGELKISSPVFESNGYIPKRYTCDGKNDNPPLEIENIPRAAKSLALIFDDRDAPRGTFVHWIFWNIDPKIKEIKEDSVPEGAIEGMNDFKKRSYGGPCPPKGTHRYYFKIYALDTHLTLDSHSKKADLEKAMKGHVIAQAQMMGMYKRK